MNIAILSGKGGTGKTTVSASFALAVPNGQYIDCDVEEPNGFLFLKPDLTKRKDVSVPVPEIDPDLCTHCGACARVCAFNALAVAGERILLFPELCHHCGACVLACPSMAMTETPRVIGVIESDEEDRFAHGCLNVGEPVGIPIIRQLKKEIDPDRTVFLDCPPGASCAVVAALDGCDYAVLVTEPTPFGLHDVRIAVQLTRKLGIPCGILINKSGDSDTMIESFCRDADVPILMRIPFSRTIAEQYARGLLPVQDPSWREAFRDLHERILKEVVQ